MEQQKSDPVCRTCKNSCWNTINGRCEACYVYAPYIIAATPDEPPVSQFNFRIGNIEARTAHHKDTLEIVQWETSTCFGIVRFVQDRDTMRWEAGFCGDRPLHADVNWKHLGELIKVCYKFLNESSL